MPCVGFEPTIPASELAKTVHVLDRSATVPGRLDLIEKGKLLVLPGIKLRLLVRQDPKLLYRLSYQDGCSYPSLCFMFWYLCVCGFVRGTVRSFSDHTYTVPVLASRYHVAKQVYTSRLPAS
jgi:hypothetical protein